MERRTWSDLTGRQRGAMGVLGVIQVGLLLAALLDLRRRDEEELTLPKRFWTGIVFINWVGPIAYFLRGRRR